MTIHNPLYSPNEGNLAERMVRLMNCIMQWKNNIELSLAHADDSFTFDDIVAMTLSGRLQFWDFEDCFCFTEIIEFPQYKNFHFFIAGGDLEAILSLKPFFQDVAQDYGCKYLTFAGRKGWERALKTAGWQHLFTTMSVEVER